MAKFHRQTVITSHIIQQNVFLALSLDILVLS